MNAVPHIAMFLGAGASKAFGAPLTNEILPQIMKQLQNGTLFRGKPDEKHHKTLKRLLNELMPGIEIVDQKHILITEILSLIDYMLLSAFVPAPMAKIEQLHSCRMLLEHAILDLLTDVHDRSNEETIPLELKQLARWMYNIGQKSRFSLVSTNYDETVESELYRCFLHTGKTRPFDGVNEAINFGLSWRDCPTGNIFYPPKNSRHAVLKLHGSVDWMKCDLCGWIICNDDYFFQRKHYHSASYEKKDKHNTCDCGHWPLRPVIIAPSLVRDIRDINILGVWKAAFEELRIADRWYIIGYSLPIDDYALRSMLIRALKSRKNPPEIEVYQWGDDPEKEARYRAFFGKDCIYHKVGMQGFIENVVNNDLFL